MSEIIKLDNYTVQETPLPVIYSGSMVKVLTSGVIYLEDQYNVYSINGDDVELISVNIGKMGRNRNICDIEFQLNISITEDKKFQLSSDFIISSLACNSGITSFKVFKKVESSKFTIEELQVENLYTPVVLNQSNGEVISALCFPWASESTLGASLGLTTNNLDILAGYENGSEANYFIDFYALTKVDSINIRFWDIASVYIKVSASMDAKNWILLDTVNPPFPNRTDYKFNVKKQSYYRYYRLCFGIASSSDRVRFNNLKFYGHKFDHAYGKLTCITPWTNSNSVSRYVYSTGYNSTYQYSYYMPKDYQDGNNRFDAQNWSDEYAWWKIELPAAEIANFAVVNKSPDSAYANRFPYWFKIEGSNDDINWTVLYEENIYKLSYNCSAKGILFPNDTAYKYYRMHDIASFTGLQYQIARYFKLFRWQNSEDVEYFNNAMPKLNAASQYGYSVSASSTADGNVVNLFDYDNNTIWAGGRNASSWTISSQFPIPTIITSILMQVRELPEQAPAEFSIEASENGTTWVELYSTGENYQTLWMPKEKRIFTFQNESAYAHYRLVIKKINNQLIQVDGNHYAGLSLLQFGSLNEPYSKIVHTYTDTYLVPIMTNNSQDSYITSCSSSYSATYPAWKAFNRNASDGWVSVNSGYPAWVQLQLPNPQIFSQIYLKVHNDFFPYSFKIQGSNDAENWTNLYSNEACLWNASKDMFIDTNNKTPFLYYRLLVFSAGNSGSQPRTEINMLDFIQRVFIDDEERGEDQQ